MHITALANAGEELGCLSDSYISIGSPTEGEVIGHSVCIMQMYKYRRTDFIETNLKPALVEACSHQMALIDSSSTQFSRHRDRLKVVREQKRKQKQELLGQ